MTAQLYIQTGKTPSGGTPSTYEAVILMKSDYYPFGMQMPGRTYHTDAYRFGYNGMEQDPEMKGQGNHYTTEFRQYDPRLGRWMSLDPLMAQFPHISPYVAFDDNPVLFVDPLGLEATADYYDINNPRKKLGSDGIDDGKVFYINKEEWTRLSTDQKQYYGTLVFQQEAIYSHGAIEETDDEMKYQLTNQERFEKQDKAAAETSRLQSSKAANPALLPKVEEKPAPREIPAGEPTMGPITPYEMAQNKAALERELLLKEMERTGMDQWGKIGQGLTYGPEAATSVFLPQYAFARLGLWMNRARLGANAITVAEATTSTARLCTNGENLALQLASESQMAEGSIIVEAGAVRDAPRLVSQYGGGASDWVKMSSTNFSKGGYMFETHWYHNTATGINVEYKTKFLMFNHIKMP